MQGKDVILGLLNEGEKTGYEINEILQTRLIHFFDGTMGMIYPILRKLEKEGKIKKQVVFQEGKPNKNIFSITEEGEADFQAYLKTSVDQEILKSDFLVRMYFGDQMSELEVQQALEEEIAHKTTRLEMLEKNLAEWEQNGMTDAQRISYDYGVTYYTSVLAVLKKAEKQHKSKK